MLLFIPIIGISQSKNESVKDIPISFKVYLDSVDTESDRVNVGITSLLTTPQICTITNSFTTFLKPDKVYNIVIGHPKYNKQTMKIDTGNGVTTMTCKIYLSSKMPDKYIGYLKYSKLFKTLIVYDK